MYVYIHVYIYINIYIYIYVYIYVYIYIYGTEKHVALNCFRMALFPGQAHP